MKIHDVRQGSVQWMELHVGIPTASGLHYLLTPELKLRTGIMPKSYLYRKLAELWREEPLIGFSTWDVEQGTILEDEARPTVALEIGQTVRTVGFITNDANAGCSPDGLIGDDCGLEIKCPAPQTHVKYLIEAVLPADYVTQVYGGLYVTGFPRWIFSSYCRGFPLLVLEIRPDEKSMAAIDKAVKDFAEKLSKARERLQFMEDQ